MNKKLLTLLKVSLFSAIALSCSSGSDDITENNTGGATGNALSLISSKTEASIDTSLKFSFTGGTTEQINNINWDFGDGNTYHGDNSLDAIYHNYKAAGNYTIKATLLLANGKSVEKTVKVTVTDTHILKIKKITIISIPQKENNLKLVYSGGVSHWENFKGAWDESKSYNTTNPDKFADLFIEIGKVSSVPALNDPHNLLVSHFEPLLTTGIYPNQMSLGFDLTGYNVFMGYETLQSVSLVFKDSDTYNSLLENGGQDEFIALYSIPISEFTGTSKTFNYGELSFKVDFEKL
ncbi:PKD domain-containing protein [Chryseobacterium tructae]|uniref:PKD domain-containing protein n=1 Tax=Chryseobacterium tructae TaxID=1037380 RepID=A0ABV7XSE8_9FLAO|nr:PKD domain-containing protein [Chryseobacterium tructae]MDN3691637.1 PKD domain-containing protein [Chryseobacterium tructae]